MTIYRIRDKQTGKFSLGGEYPLWSTRGKVWTTLGGLRLHLNQIFFPEYNKSRDLDTTHWEVIEYEVVETEKSRYPIYDAVDPKKLVEILKK